MLESRSAIPACLCNEIPDLFYQQRRTGARPQPAQATPSIGKATVAPKASTPTVKAESKPNPPRETKAPTSKAPAPSQAKPKDETPQQSSQSKKPATKTPGLKREQSDIFKSFAKPSNKLSRENTGSSVGASPAPEVVRFSMDTDYGDAS
ncbi:MAG: hypothetical protein Q9169_003286 [Polycauliona sp. 2 TL-2023]